MTLFRPGRPSYAAEPAGGQRAETVRRLYGVDQSKRHRPPVTLAGSAQVRPEVVPPAAAPKPPRRHWRKYE